MSGAADKHALFTQWAKDQGVEIDGVKPAKLPGRGLGLVTTKKIKPDERLLFVPEKAMFKPDSALLKKHGLEGISPQAQLAVSATHSFHDQEPLQVWQQTWPTHTDFEKSLPLQWAPSVQELLPSSVQQPLERQRADYRKDWNAVAEFCDQRYSETTFAYMWTIVNSRSFYWKPPRGKSGCMVMCPFIDYMNHGPDGTGCRVVQTAKGYEVVADRDYDAGEEVLATYGAHSNDKLLVHYGFICSHLDDGHSTDDDIRIDHLVLPKLSESIRDQLQDVGFLGGYSLLPAENELCFKTQVAVRAVLLTCNEWEHFVSSGEDLTVDHTPAVNAWIVELLAEYRETATERLVDVDNIEWNDVAKSSLTMRWNQIIDAIDRFL